MNSQILSLQERFEYALSESNLLLLFDMNSQILSLQERFEYALSEVQKSTVAKALVAAKAEVAEWLDAEDDDDDWIGQLSDFQKRPEDIQQHIDAAIADEVRFDESVLTAFFEAVKDQLSPEVVEQANIVVIRYGEHEKMHLDLYQWERSTPLCKDIHYAKGFYVNGVPISEHEERLGETSMRAAKFYNHPIDESQLFMSIDDDYFGNVLWLRDLRLQQDLLKKTKSFLLANYPMTDYQFLIGDYNNQLWSD